jgi:glycosyltransferase involved in cell wall biosynthesis
MRVIAFVPCIPDTSPGQRFRLEQWAPRLRESGVEIRFEPFESAELNRVIYSHGNTLQKARLIAGAFMRRISALREVRNYDVAYVFREAALLGPAIFERWIWRTGVPLIFDFDDAVFVPYFSPSNGCLSLLKCPGKARTTCRISAHVMAGNAYLADYAQKVNRNVTIIPTTIDTDKYTVESRLQFRGPLTIGWSGSHSTVQHLDTLRDALSMLASKETFRLKVIGAARYHLEGVVVDSIPWKSTTEIADLRSIDIGIMPLPDNRWSQGKCGLKALQYMSLGIPTVCSQTGVNSVIIRDGQNGYTASSNLEWVDKLSRLLHSPDLRARLGAAGRATVEEHYSARAQTPRVYEVFKTVADHCPAE